MVVSNNPIRNITGDLDVSGLQLNNRRQKLRQRFDILRKLGQGTYGKVQLALNKETGEEVAIKTIKKAKIETEQDLIRIQREIQIMSSMQHPHIIHIYEVFENKEKIVLVMEYACGGELYDFLNVKKTLSESEARRIFRQISSAVYYCHKNKICHRDLKLENILLDENGNAKIADFGLSNIFNEQRLLNTFCGSPLYASPEIVKGTPYYGPEVDCWSLGVLLYTLVYGAMPFDGSNFRRLVKQISEGDYYEPKKPSEASMLIRHLLTVAPAKRATIEDVCEDWWINLSYDDSLLAVAEELGKIPLLQLDFVHQSRSTDTVNEEPINTKENNKKEEEKSLTNSTAESNLSIQSEPNNTEALTDSLTSQPELSYTVETESDENKQQKQSQDTVTIKEISDDNLSQSFSEVKKDDVIENNFENQDSIQEVTKPIETEQEFVENDPNIEENCKNVPILENNEDINQEMNESCSTMISEDFTSHSENSVAKSPEICSEMKSEKSEIISEKSGKLSNEVLVSTKLKSSSDNIEETNLESKPKPKARSASLKTTTLNTNIKEKKSFVYPGLRVSEAKLAFENKQVDKKIKATPGLKVSSARKAFEVTSNESLTTRRASMPAKLKVLELEDKTAIKTKQPLSKIDATETKQKDVVKPQKKIAGFLPTLDVTVAVKPRKDLGKPPPFPRADTSTTSGTSSGENTPDIIVKNPPFKTSSAKSRRSSCPKSTSISNSDKIQETEPRQRSKSDADTEANNPVIISGESSLKSSSSTLTGNDTDKNEMDEVKDDSRKEMIKNSNDSTDLPEKVSKISCMEIQLSNNTSQQQVQEIKTTMAEPQFILRQPPGGGKFTLLGVTSEVLFDVAAAPEVEIPTVEIKTSPRKQSSNLFMSVTLPPPPPPSDYGSDNDDVTSETSNTKTLKTEDVKRKSQLRKSTEKQQKMADYNTSLKRNRTNQTPSERYYRDISKNPETLHGRQGYNVYRSKFCSLQKAFLNEPNRWPRDRSVERSESFSSTGSIDDMEDVYDCFTPNSSQYSTDDVPTTSRQLSYSKKVTDTERRSKMDVPRRYEDTASPMSSGFGSSRLIRPQIYDRSCSNSRSSWSSAHFRNSPSSNSVRDYGSDADTLLSDSSSKNQWGYRKSSQEDDNNDDLVTKSLYHYKNRCSSLSRSVSEDESASLNEDQSPTSSLSSKYISSSKRTSLSSRFRSEKCKDEVNPMTSSLHNQETVNKLPHYPYTSTYTRRRTSNDDMLNNTTDFGANQSSNYRYESASKNNPVTQKDSFDYSIYGTTRRTRSCNKSATQELSSTESKKSDAPEESVQRRRPRSLILSDTDWSPTKQGQIDNKRDSSSSSSSSQYRFNRASNSCDRLEESSDIKKKLDREFESQYASQTTQRNLRSFWRAGSHGREIGTGLNKRKSLDDNNRPSLLRRASLSEDPRSRFGCESGKSNNNLPNGAAEYWAKRYGTNGRVHPTKEEGSEDKNKARKGTDLPSPVRRRSSAGIETGNDDERTRGLLQYARTISHELNQLHSDLTATFKKRKDKEKEIESETESKIENKKETKDIIKNEVGNVVEELKRLENDLISLGAAPKKEIKIEILNDDDKPVIVNKPIEKVEKKISLEEFECGSSGTATPTDQDDTCSLCSDYENRSGTSSGLEESVSERIRRKSYFARFQDKRGKNRATNRNNSETKTHCRHCRNKVASESNVETDKSDKLDTEKQLSNNYSRHSMPREIRYNNNTEENGGDDEKGELNSSDVRNNRKISKDGSNESINSQVSDSHSGRASSVVPELLQPSTYSKSFYRHHSTSDFLRPISPISRRLSTLDNTTSSSTNGYMGSGWSTYERRKSRPSASIFSSLPLEATVQSRANLRSRHDYLINRALSSLDDRNPRPLTPNSRRMSSYHDNYMTDMRRFSAILDNSSPRDVIRKALDIL